MVRRRGQFETVYELLRESGFEDDEIDLLMDTISEDRSVDNSDRKECRCLEKSDEDLFQKEILASRSAGQGQAIAEHGSDDSGHAQLQLKAGIEQPASENVKADFVQQAISLGVSAQREVIEDAVHSPKTITSLNLRWTSAWLPVNSTWCITRDSRSDWQLPRDCRTSHRTIAAFASRITLTHSGKITSSLDTLGWSEMLLKICDMFAYTSSPETATLVGDDAV